MAVWHFKKYQWITKELLLFSMAFALVMASFSPLQQNLVIIFEKEQSLSCISLMLIYGVFIVGSFMSSELPLRKRRELPRNSELMFRY